MTKMNSKKMGGVIFKFSKDEDWSRRQGPNFKFFFLRQFTPFICKSNETTFFSEQFVHISLFILLNYKLWLVLLFLKGYKKF